MMKQSKKHVFWSILVLLLPMLLGLLLWSRLPERIPSHWNLAGEVDGWSSRTMTVFGLPGILLACHLFCIAGMYMDPKHRNISGKIVALICWIVPVIGIPIMAGTYAIALGVRLRMEILVTVLVGVIFVICGNLLPKCQPNYTAGIKLPWTLDNEDNWRKTHRMAGPVWVICGIAVGVSGFLGKPGVILLLAALAVMLLAPIIYSYLLYRKEANN